MTRHCIEPDWPAPASVIALSTTRAGGHSVTPYDSFNLAHHVGDEAAVVGLNRRDLHTVLPPNTTVQWLNQVHGVTVVEAGAAEELPSADASWSRTPGRACAVMTADCLPVLLCSRQGDVVAAAHAGWRGLCEGVLEATVRAMSTAPEQVLAWLGPAIGSAAFEVGPEVREQFLLAAAESTRSETESCFVPGQQRGRYLADLYQLARIRLVSQGVEAVYGGGECTFNDPDRFFSYRRDGTTGRMASLILLAPR